jgi:hypothetical protein
LPIDVIGLVELKTEALGSEVISYPHYGTLRAENDSFPKKGAQKTGKILISL